MTGVIKIAADAKLNLGGTGMQKRDVVLCALMACLSAVVLGQSVAEDELHWFDNYREALQAAKRTQKPIFLEFRCEP
jgi:hypothetical protein